MLLPPTVPPPDTLKGIDDLIRIDFEGFRAIWFARLLAATFLVVVGLVMEGPELWHEIHSIIWRFSFNHRFHFSRPEERLPEWAKLLAFVGWIFIVGGVGGEFVADSFVSRADGFVQKFDEILLADAQKKTGAASERAARAFERAAQTEREASQENERAARAEQQATEENARAAKALEAAEVARKNVEGYSLQIAQANERASKAEAQAAEATLELARLKTNRLLTNVAAFISAMTPFKGTKFTFDGVFQDQESMDLAEEISNALQHAGWEPTDPPNTGRMGIPWMRLNNFPPLVAPTIKSGVHVSTGSAQKAEVLQALPQSQLPQPFPAAFALKATLASSIVPSQNNLAGDVMGVTEFAPAVLIEVGKKP
jgi:hypothetical protein